MSELPDIKIFHHGRPSNFEAAASTTNIVDIARWNAGHQQWKDQQWSRVIKIEGNDGLARAFEKEQMLLIAFTNHWCTWLGLGLGLGSGLGLGFVSTLPPQL